MSLFFVCESSIAAATNQKEVQLIWFFMSCCELRLSYDKI